MKYALAFAGLVAGALAGGECYALPKPQAPPPVAPYQGPPPPPPEDQFNVPPPPPVAPYQGPPPPPEDQFNAPPPPPPVAPYQGPPPPPEDQFNAPPPEDQFNVPPPPAGPYQAPPPPKEPYNAPPPPPVEPYNAPPPPPKEPHHAPPPEEPYHAPLPPPPPPADPSYQAPPPPPEDPSYHAPPSTRAPAPDSGYFALAALRDGTPIDYQGISAIDGKFYIGAGKSSSHCDDKLMVSCLEEGATTVFTGGNKTLSLGVRVPGGQQVYVAKDGSLRYTDAFSTSNPSGAVVDQFSKTDDGNVHFETGFVACPVGKNGGYQVYGQVDGFDASSECLGFTAAPMRVADKPGAWRY